jgi:hypothetical protein
VAIGTDKGQGAVMRWTVDRGPLTSRNGGGLQSHDIHVDPLKPTTSVQRSSDVSQRNEKAQLPFGPGARSAPE